MGNWAGLWLVAGAVPGLVVVSTPNDRVEPTGGVPFWQFNGVAPAAGDTDAVAELRREHPEIRVARRT